MLSSPSDHWTCVIFCRVTEHLYVMCGFMAIYKFDFNFLTLNLTSSFLNFSLNHVWLSPLATLVHLPRQVISIMYEIGLRCQIRFKYIYISVTHLTWMCCVTLTGCVQITEHLEFTWNHTGRQLKSVSYDNRQK